MRIFKYYFVISYKFIYLFIYFFFSYKFKLIQTAVEKLRVHQIFRLDPRCGHCLGPCLNGDSSIQTYQEHTWVWMVDGAICLHMRRHIGAQCEYMQVCVDILKCMHAYLSVLSLTAGNSVASTHWCVQRGDSSHPPPHWALLG